MMISITAITKLSGPWAEISSLRLLKKNKGATREGAKGAEAPPLAK